MSDDDYRILPEFPRYLIYRDGRIQSHKGKFYATRGVPPTVVLVRGDGEGYVSKCVRNLVCEAFHGAAPPNTRTVESISGDPASTHADDLRWQPAQWNKPTAIENRSRRVQLQVLEQNRDALLASIAFDGLSHANAARRFGVTLTSLHRYLGITKTDYDTTFVNNYDKIHKLKADGWSIRRLAEHFDMPWHVLYAYLREEKA